MVQTANIVTNFFIQPVIRLGFPLVANQKF
jgi:hypothetical protein